MRGTSPSNMRVDLDMLCNQLDPHYRKLFSLEIMVSASQACRLAASPFCLSRCMTEPHHPPIDDTCAELIDNLPTKKRAIANL